MRASFLRRLLCTAALAGGLLVLGGGAANATDIVPGGDAILTQTQDATNTNPTDQTATTDAETRQVNVNAPIAVLSPGANSGDVDQSNTADTSATASNTNTTDQSIWQGQDGTTSDCGSCGGLVSQDQSGENTNDTSQDAHADASTTQYNVNVPLAILSPGAGGSSCDPCGGSGGDVNQSNDAETSAWAGNQNDTTQTVGQSQDAAVAGSSWECGCRDASVEQSQTGSNDNSTDQDATANAETTQVNVNAPIAILSPGANSGDVDQSNQADTDATASNGNTTDQSIWQDQDAAVRGDGCGTCHSGGGSISQDQAGENTNQTDQDATADATTEQKNVNVPIAILSPACGCLGGGDVHQSNDATTTAWTGNSNGTSQSVKQGQDGRIWGGHGCGGCQPSPCDCHPDPCSQPCDPNPCDCQPDPCSPCEPKPCDCEPNPCALCEPQPCGCAHQGSIDQSQTGSNANDTHQDAEANAVTYQKNENKPFSFFSPGAGGGGVTQSNGAATAAWAGNGNATGQVLDQAQYAALRR